MVRQTTGRLVKQDDGHWTCERAMVKSLGLVKTVVLGVAKKSWYWCRKLNSESPDLGIDNKSCSWFRNQVISVLVFRKRVLNFSLELELKTLAIGSRVEQGDGNWACERPAE